jgi:hypothetical protein
MELEEREIALVSEDVKKLSTCRFMVAKHKAQRYTLKIKKPS